MSALYSAAVLMAAGSTLFSAERPLLDAEMRQEISRIGKIATWGIIGGTALTMYTMYKAREQARRQESWTPYVMAAGAAPVTFTCGALAAGGLKAVRPLDAVKYTAQGTLAVAKFTLYSCPKFLISNITAPYRAARWLMT